MLAGVIAPFVNAGRFKERIRSALETSLGRKVEFDRASFTLFSGPGFSLEKVIIAEDSRYGIEPFAYVPTLEARVRLDKLLLGEIRFTSLRLEDPSLNLVRAADGTWNIVGLMQRLSAPRRAPLNLLPAFEVSDGRIDFKYGIRKTTLYISDSDLSIYPERSGKVYVRFSGSPARTDRSGVGFGHFRGAVNWYASGVRSNQIEGEVNLDPSNLSELTTLFAGNDVGVHGTISSTLHLEGPASALDITGEMRLADVHRWDLLPSSGEDWPIRYRGKLDLFAHTLDLRTIALPSGQAPPVALHLLVNDFLAHARCSVVAELKQAPLENLALLAPRMGIVLPNGAALHGALNGTIGFSTDAGWSGGVTVNDAEALLPGAPVLHAVKSDVTLSSEAIHFAPTNLIVGDPATSDSGSDHGQLRMSGDYFFSDGRTNASLGTVDFPAGDLKLLTASWIGAVPALAAVRGGVVSGQLSFNNRGNRTNADGGEDRVSWDGQLELSDASMRVPGLGIPLEAARGRVEFSATSFALDRFSATYNGSPIRATYRYNAAGRHAEHARIEMAQADLAELGSAIAQSRPESVWSRLRFRRHSPATVDVRDLEGDLIVHHVELGDKTLGALSSHLVWQGSDVKLSDFSLQLIEGSITGEGSADLSLGSPRWRFTARTSGYRWGGGTLSADGTLTTEGTRREFLSNLKGNGTFSGEGVILSPNDRFTRVAGDFRFSFVDGWPDLNVENIQALESGEEWNGTANSQNDGKLLVDLVHAGQQAHFVSSLSGDTDTAPGPDLPREASRQ